jgi:hypothetical protein
MKDLRILLNLTHEELRRAFDAVEYPGFFDKGPFGINSNSNQSISGVLKNKKRISKDYESEKNSFSCEELRELCDMNVGTIYGNGGFNRYFVYFDGRIVFSEYHAIDEKATCKAFLAGFEVCVEGKRTNDFYKATGSVTFKNGSKGDILGVNDDRFVCRYGYSDPHGEIHYYFSLVELDCLADFDFDYVDESVEELVAVS